VLRHPHQQLHHVLFEQPLQQLSLHNPAKPSVTSFSFARNNYFPSLPHELSL
jgi:hypothetical protein